MISKCNVALLIILTGACHQRDTSLTETEKKGIIRDVQQTLHNYYADIRSKGLTAEFDYLDSTSDFFWVPPGSSISISYDSVYKVLFKNASLYKLIDNAWDTLKITAINEDLALYTGRLRSTVTDTSDQVSTIRLIETGVLIKRKDGWKLLSGQTSLLDGP